MDNGALRSSLKLDHSLSGLIAIISIMSEFRYSIPLKLAAMCNRNNNQFSFFVVVERFEGRFFLSMRPTYSNEWKRGRIWWLHCLFPPRFCYVFYGNTCANTSSSFQPTRNVDITNRNTHTQSIISYIWISSINANIYSHDTVQLHAAPN